ncbi:MAG: hypothetical protein D6830_05905 [Ignavibacteria bacterium]|nr:MAG: hypothetical protein D6830_05905 [Ignavibacteria bacterium]
MVNVEWWIDWQEKGPRKITDFRYPSGKVYLAGANYSFIRVVHFYNTSGGASGRLRWRHKKRNNLTIVP